VTEPDFLSTTRTFYDAVAADYAARFYDELAAKPLDRSMLAAFAQHVRTSGGGQVADIGCGPGHVTAHLNELGLSVFGIDLSSHMVSQARRANPDLRFDEGSMTDLDLRDGSLGGIVAWYSVIHIPDGLLPQTLDGFHRVLAQGGHLLLAFQVGDEPLHLARPMGHPVSLDFHRRQPDRLVELLEEAGFALRGRLLREPDDSGQETTQQAFLLARKL
jgi:SAM-dependent methyltransferase